MLKRLVTSFFVCKGGSTSISFGRRSLLSETCSGLDGIIGGSSTSEARRALREHGIDRVMVVVIDLGE